MTRDAIRCITGLARLLRGASPDKSWGRLEEQQVEEQDNKGQDTTLEDEVGSLALLSQWKGWGDPPLPSVLCPLLIEGLKETLGHFQTFCSILADPLFLRVDFCSCGFFKGGGGLGNGLI